jgi:ribonuclease Z
MLDVCLPGTGGTMPQKDRWLACAVLRYRGKTLLLDCGEGTQIALKESGFRTGTIGTICLTHFHADHVAGLPGLLLTMGNEGRTEPVTIAGPKGTEAVVRALCIIAAELPFAVQIREWGNGDDLLERDGFCIRAFSVRHKVACYGYEITIPRSGRFCREKAEALGLERALWGDLQKGLTVCSEGREIRPEEVLGPPRRGLKLVYATDTRPTETIRQAAQQADLLVLEGMYGEATPRAEETCHMLMSEAALLARDAGAGARWLTHYGPALQEPEEFLPGLQSIFPETVCAKDGDNVSRKLSRQTL